MAAKTIPSVTRALEILKLFRNGNSTLSVPEIIAQLELARTTAHDLVQTLLACGYLERVEEQPYRFKLGLCVFQLGCTYEAQLDLAEEGRKIAREMSEASGETIQMAIRDGAEAVFLIRVDSNHMLRLVSAVGSKLPAHCTAVGKMLLSPLTEQELRALYKGQTRLSAMTLNSISSFEDLLKELAVVSKRGYAEDDCESNEDAKCLAAPIYDRNGGIRAAISITVPVTRMNADRKNELLRIVQGGAREISCRLGYGLKNV